MEQPDIFLKIIRMFQVQRERNFSLPDYNLLQEGKVSVRITGKIIDRKYTRMLVRCKDLDMRDVIALDKVQKGQRLSEPVFASLKSKKLVEGRRPNLYVSEAVAAETGTRADYIRKRPFDRGYFKKLIIEYLKTYHEVNRSTVEDLLIDKVSNALNEKQKRQYVKDLLQEMRKDGTLEPIVKTRGARWILAAEHPP